MYNDDKWGQFVGTVSTMNQDILLNSETIYLWSHISKVWPAAFGQNRTHDSSVVSIICRWLYMYLKMLGRDSIADGLI